MAKNDDGEASIWAKQFAHAEQPETEPKPEQCESEPNPPEPEDTAKPESGNVFGLPKNKFVAYDVDAGVLRSPGALVLFPGLKRVEPIWESTSNTSIGECISKIAYEPAAVFAVKDRVPYFIAGVLKEAELKNERLRGLRIKAGLSTIGKQRSGSHIESLGPLLVFDDDHDAYARIPLLQALGWFAVVYPSWSYMQPKGDAGPEPRGRVALLLNRTFSPVEHTLLWDACNHLLGGGFDETGQSPSQCYGIYARRSADAPPLRRIIQGGALDADALIEFGRTLQPPRPEKTTAASGHAHGPLTEELERVRLMGTVRPPDEYDDWFPAAGALKREYPDDEERAFLCFDAWSACSCAAYKGPEDARRKFNQVARDHDGPELTVAIMYARARRRALKVLTTLYPQQAKKIVPIKIAEAFKHLTTASHAEIAAEVSKPAKGDEPIEPGSIGVKDAIVALEYLLFCHGRASKALIEGIPIPQAVLEKAHALTEARRARIALRGRTLHSWDGGHVGAGTDALADTFLRRNPQLYGYDKTNKVLVRLSSPAGDPATAARIRELHDYKGKPGDKDDPAQGKGKRLVPMLSADKPALRALISNDLAMEKTIEIGKGKEKTQLKIICSFAFKSNVSLLQEPDASVLDDLLRRVLPERARQTRGIITAPVIPRLPASIRPADLLQSATCDLITEVGLDPRTGWILAPIGMIVDVPVDPTPEQTQAAADLLQQPWWDMPFAAPGEGLEPAVSHSVALLGTIIAANRRALEKAPGIAIDAPPDAASTGKTNASKLFGIMATGEEPVPVVLSGSYEEQRKALVTYFVTGNGAILIDNIPAGMRVDSAALNVAMTSPQIMDRLLGANKDVIANTQAMIIINGSALDIAGDLPSRFLKIRLDTGLERPEGRSNANFKITTLIPWMLENRQRLVAAAHTLIRAYWQACRKAGGSPLDVVARRKVDGSRFDGPVEFLRDVILWAFPELPDPFLGFEASTLSSSTRQEKAQALRALDRVMSKAAGEKCAPEWVSYRPGIDQIPERFSQWREKFVARWKRIARRERQRCYGTDISDRAWTNSFERVQRAVRTRYGRRELRAGRARFTSQEIIIALQKGNEHETETVREAMHWEGYQGQVDSKISPASLSKKLKRTLVDRPIDGLVLRSKQDAWKKTDVFWIERN